LTETKATYIFLDNAPESASVQVYQCQKRWDELELTGHESVRFCDQCKQTVHQVVDVDGFQRAVAQGQCIMVSGFANANAPKSMVVGQPEMNSYAAGVEQPKDDAF